MSHELDFSNGRVNMAYVGDPAWHGLGNKLSESASIDVWRVEAGLNFNVESHPVYTKSNNTYVEVPGKKALIRDDTKECLSIMTDHYKIVQPSEVLEFYRELVDKSLFSIETAGSLKGGRKLWALAKCKLELNVRGHDLIKPYLLLATSCDGTMATVADFTTIRVVCNNTLTMAVGGNTKKSAIRIPHGTEFNMSKVKSDLGLIDDRLTTFGEDVDTLSRCEVSPDDATAFFTKLYAQFDRNGDVKNPKAVARITDNLQSLYTSGKGADLKSSKGTTWGLVNAVTHYEDFLARSRSPENRFSNSQFGRGAGIKRKAFDNALLMAS